MTLICYQMVNIKIIPLQQIGSFFGIGNPFGLPFLQQLLPAVEAAEEINIPFLHKLRKLCGILKSPALWKQLCNQVFRIASIQPDLI